MTNTNTTKVVKVTKAQYFGMVRNIVESAETANKADILAFIDHEVELLQKKSNKSGNTKTQQANEAILDTIKTVLAETDKPVTISELMTDDRLKTYVEGTETKTMTNQKLSALVKKLCATNEVVRTEDKKKAFFSLA
jgi:translation initiation factor 1 (eIF-1/SUI1)